MIALYCMLGPAVVLADIYEKIDENGSVSYSDNPLDDQYVLIIEEPVLSAKNVDNETIGTNPIPGHIQASVIATPSELLTHIQSASAKHHVDPDLIHAVIHVESAYKQYARSGKGAIGLMQLMPATAKRMGVIDIYNPIQNIEGGTRYLRQLLNMFDNDVQLALAAYNAGERSVVRYGKRIPPFRETQAYVPKVMHIYQALRKQRAEI